MTFRISMPLAAIAMTLATGCATVQPSPASFTVRQFFIPNDNVVMDAAAMTLRDFGYRLEVVNRQAGRLMTYPLEFVPEDAPRRIGTSTPSRRVAEVRIEGLAESSAVYCKVLLQRQTTETHRLFAQDQRRDDLPGQTPLEREGAGAREHSTVWETVGRDKSQERAILSDISSRIDPTDQQDG